MNLRKEPVLFVVVPRYGCRSPAEVAAGRAELSADEIIEKANQASYYAGADGKADVTMTIKAGTINTS